jgi:hypothetical protein
VIKQGTPRYKIIAASFMPADCEKTAIVATGNNCGGREIKAPENLRANCLQLCSNAKTRRELSRRVYIKIALNSG